MKVQLQTGSMRLRIDESELADLLAGNPLALRCAVAATPLFALRLTLSDRLQLQLTPAAGWQLTLPTAALRDYATTLPRRDALVLELGDGAAPLRIDLEVDVRDSLQRRGPRRR